MRTSITTIVAVAVQLVILVSVPAQGNEDALFTTWLTYVPSMEDRLRSAASSGNLEEISRLLSRGAKIDSSDIDGWTPLIAAVTSDQPEAVSLLLKRGARVNAKGTKTGHSALSWSVMLGYSHLTEILLDGGADIETRNNRGRTPLMESSLRGHEATTQLLLARGADPNVKDQRGRTALDFAALGGHDDVVSVLMAGGAASDVTTYKLLSKAGLGPQAKHRAASAAGPDLSQVALSSAEDDRGGRTQDSQAYTVRLARVWNTGKASIPKTGSVTSRGIVIGSGGVAAPQQLAGSIAVPSPERLGLALKGNESDSASLRSLAGQAKTLWEQIQSQHPEVALAVQAGAPHLVRAVHP